MATFAEIQNVQAELIRKAKAGSAFLAPVTAAGIDETFVGAGGVLATLPAGYDDLGWLSSDGMGFSRDVATSDITSFGATSPTRSDITSDTSSITVTCQETKLLTIGLATGVDTSTIKTPDSSGAVMVRKPKTPSSKYYRLFCISKDEGDAGDIYIARFFPRAKVTSFSEQSFGGGDEPISWGVTMQGYPDDTLGFSEAWLFGGPGWNAIATEMGFDDVVAPAVPANLRTTSVAATSVALAWDAVADAASYRLQDNGTTVAGAETLTTTSFTHTVAASSSHSYTVSAVDAAGNRSAESAALAVTTPAA